MLLKEVSYAHQGCIYFDQKFVTTTLKNRLFNVF